MADSDTPDPVAYPPASAQPPTGDFIPSTGVFVPDGSTAPPQSIRSQGSLESPSTRYGRFAVVRPLAKGGLGEVFVAHDEELDRQVALKRIQDRWASSADSQRR